MDLKVNAPDSLVGEYQLVLTSPSQVQHRLQLTAHYTGENKPGPGDTVALTLHLSCDAAGWVGQPLDMPDPWTAVCEYPSGLGDLGYVEIGGGRYLPKLLRGRGLGTLMQSILVAWTLDHVSAPVSELTLAGEDATTKTAIDRRHRFWTNFGITFADSEQGDYQVSVPMCSCNLVTPPLPSFNRKGWCLTFPDELRAAFGLVHRTWRTSAPDQLQMDLASNSFS
ncbi:hypothetical protein E5C33_10850 [Stenotrophomonas maltophilia]|uniref:hypothetical protein n=1 Tax=Stenotrophomonas maltophilia TaxID=40324 RepID=UPI001075EA59|nr:hypothetical protein [Stenotrophomonas maltophilia]TFZ45279.1 hypothetical protein E5C33_10850 [Stenotrophomonas maltophilia]